VRYTTCRHHHAYRGARRSYIDGHASTVEVKEQTDAVAFRGALHALPPAALAALLSWPANPVDRVVEAVACAFHKPRVSTMFRASLHVPGRPNHDEERVLETVNWT
jgi:hypothetical protein